MAIPEEDQFAHRILNLSDEESYRIKLRAVNSVGAGSETFAIDVTVRDLSLPAYGTPPVPVGLKGVAGFGTVLLTWENPFAHYRNHARTVVYRSASDNFSGATEIGASTGVSFWITAR